MLYTGEVYTTYNYLFESPQIEYAREYTTHARKYLTDGYDDPKMRSDVRTRDMGSKYDKLF